MSPMTVVRSVADLVKVCTRSSTVEIDEDNALRKACANQMVIGLMEWLAPDTVQLDQIIVQSVEPWEQWIGKSNKELRYTTASLGRLRRRRVRKWIGGGGRAGRLCLGRPFGLGRPCRRPRIRHIRIAILVTMM